ncbi:MAG: extracellular solute-binding protein [Erysipelotrichaceae bacterium]|nr:extracellular solute-binding protein [Erysipelotrichaceae bacterium]
MKKLLSIMLVVLMAISLVACGNKADETANDGQSENTLDGTYDVTLWVSESEGVADLTKQQIDKFMEENPGIVINATIEGISEADSATTMITDVESGADIFCFAQDQLARLVQAGALNALGEQTTAEVTEANDAGSVNAATVDGKVYCFPMTSDNGYFMYYDKSVISEDQIDDLATLVKACEDNNKLFSMEYKTSAWYNAAFFFATGCVSDWTTASDGKFTSVNDTFDSAEGLVAMKGMEILAKSPSANSSSDGADFSKGAAVVITGTWASSTIKDILGDNMGVADLPSFTVDGQTYHLGSFSGNKLMGVKPQADAKKAAVCQKLALYLTNEECQLARFNLVGWGPSNKVAQADPAVTADPTLAALASQNAYAIPQGQIHGSWWDIAKVLGTVCEEATSDEDLQAGLDSYKASIDALFALSGYGCVGAWNGWDNTDSNMSQDGENWTVTINVEQSDYMGGRIVVAGEWGNDLGYAQVVEGAELLDTAACEDAGNTDNNFIFAAPGTYTVSFNETSKEVKIAQ